MSTASYPAPTSPLYEVACAYLRASNDQDWTALEATLADSFTHQIHPASIRTHGHEDRLAKTDFLERAKMMLGKGKMFEALNWDVDHPVNVVEGDDAIVMQLSSNGVLASGKAFPMEYVHIFRFDGDHKIITVESWHDSALSHSAMPGAAHPKFGEGGQVTNLEEAVEAMTSQQ